MITDSRCGFKCLNKQTIKGLGHVVSAIASLTQGYSLLAAYY